MGRALRARTSPSTETSNLIRPPIHVTAIVASHDGADFLPRTLAALRNQSRPIERFVGVDASSSDASLEVLRANLPSNAALLVADEGSLGLSLEVAVSQLPEARQDRDEWLWIIHDDSMPAPDALEHLTRTVEASESVSIAGCKLLDIDNPRHLVEVGLSVDRKAQRLTMIDTDEVDQGQYDGRSDYFAVSSAGMFIRREVFEDLGGFDPAIPGRGDDVDLCWRNRLAGHRVVVVPAAKMYHQVEVVNSLAGPREAKRSEVFQRLKFASPLVLPFLWIGLLLSGIGHLLVALLAKDPGHGFSHLGATLRGLFTPGKLASSRRNVADIRQIPRRQVRKLMTSASQVREYRRNLNTGRDDADVYGDGSGADATVEPSGDNFSDFVRIARPPRTTAVLSLILALLLSVAASMIAWRNVIGASALSGGALRPFSQSTQEIGANALSWWQNITTGLSAPPDNSDMLFWLFSLVTFGHANQASAFLFLAAMPLAAFTAWWGIGAVSRSRAVRFFAALIWALLPSLTSSLASGRVGSALVHILLPLFVLAVLRSMNAHVGVEGAKPKTPKQRSVSAWTASASAALLLWAISAGSMAFFLTLTVLIYVLALSALQRARSLWWIPLPALVWNLPLLIAALSESRLLFTEPGAGTAFSPASPWQMLLGFPEAFDPQAGLVGWDMLPTGPWALVAALLIGAPVIVLAVVGTLSSAFSNSVIMRRNSRRLLFGAVLALAAGWGVGFIPVTMDSHTTVTAYTGPFVSFVAFAFMASAANALAALRQEDKPRALRAGASRAVLGSMAVLVVVAVLASGSVLLATQLNPTASSESLTKLVNTQQVSSSQPRTLPATAADAGRSEFQERTLVLSPRSSGEIDSQLVSGSGETLDSISRYSQVKQLTGSLLNPERNEGSITASVQSKAVAMLLSESALDSRDSLRELGIGYIVLNETGESVPATVRTLDAATGLASVGQTDSGWLWRVDYGTSADTEGTGFARIIDKDGAVTVLPSDHGRINKVQVPASDSERTLVLATAADPKLRASLDGESLRSVAYPEDSETRWAQAFEIPATGGELTLSHKETMTTPMLILGGVILLITVLLAIPVPSSRRFANYRNSDYRFREPRAENEELADGSEVLAAAEVQGPSTATGTLPRSRREARERANEIRENLTPKLNDRISDDEAEQEKK
ncbi:glycosyltransferase family 2 protein [Glutamicibacter ectropisis]|uniref:Glycosyltransferase family 2 protein n=1 Tax=Glutamicibacter ectropisis TaxID=3046593 RepID=A0AAU6WFI5_9MICC